ncbi:MAG TPA: HAD family hydrolase [Pyrinomonadaceae bacterium]|nr:HAD family hydrolase [Pyrinomonadaceae bacterium]
MNLAIFDIDGTLTNTNNVDEDCFVKALAEVHSINDIVTDWTAYPHTTDSGITQHIFEERFGRSPEETELSKFKNCFVGMLSQQYQTDSLNFAEIPGASVALQMLKQDSDWAVAIATGCWRESALLKLKVANIDTDGIPGAYAEDGLSREDILKAAVSRSLEQHGVSCFERTVSIGDGLWDVRTAGRLSFAFLGIGCGESASRLQQAGARHVIADFSDYDRVLKFLREAEIPTLDYFNVRAAPSAARIERP